MARKTRRKLDEGRYAPRGFYIPTTGALGFYLPAFSKAKNRQIHKDASPIERTCETHEEKK